MSATHHTLQIDEVLQIIVAFADGDDLRSMALTCRIFYDPTMDRLWETMSSMQRMLRCLPEEFIGPVQFGNRQIVSSVQFCIDLFHSSM